MWGRQQTYGGLEAQPPAGSRSKLKSWPDRPLTPTPEKKLTWSTTIPGTPTGKSGVDVHPSPVRGDAPDNNCDISSLGTGTRSLLSVFLVVNVTVEHRRSAEIANTRAPYLTHCWRRCAVVTSCTWPSTFWSQNQSNIKVPRSHDVYQILRPKHFMTYLQYMTHTYYIHRVHKE